MAIFGNFNKFKWITHLVWILAVKLTMCAVDQPDSVHGENRILQRHPRSVSPGSESSFRSSLYFHGNKEMLKLKPSIDDIILPNEEFTLQMWIKPEGGQYRRTPIVGKNDS
ncbi:hypothetical protein ACF0H5_021861 [Mactra antiquata]